MTFPLSQYDPEDLRNIILGILSRLNALEGGYVVVNEVSEIVEPETGTPPITELGDLDWSENWKMPFVYDEFIRGGEVSGEIGDMGWVTDGAIDVTHNPLVSITHPGSVEIYSLDGADVYIALPIVVFTSLDPLSFIQFIVFGEDTLALSSDGIAVGLMYPLVAVDGSAEGVYFLSTGADSNWQAITRDGVGITQTDTGVACDNKWFLFEIKQPTTGTLDFYMNEVLVATHTTNIPTVGFPVVALASGSGPAAVLMNVDYFGMQLTPITERWD